VAEPVAIDFYLGLGSRYSYLAASQLERIEAKYRCRFVWKPIASGALMDRRGGNPFRGTPGSGQYDWGYREYDACWALTTPVQSPFRWIRALAWPAWPPTVRALVPCRLLQQLIFVEGAVIDDAVIAAVPIALASTRRSTGPGNAQRARDTKPAGRGRHTRRVRRSDLPRRSHVLGQRSPGAARRRAARRDRVRYGAAPSEDTST
jgi:hypothetical protein